MTAETIAQMQMARYMAATPDERYLIVTDAIEVAKTGDTESREIARAFLKSVAKDEAGKGVDMPEPITYQETAAVTMWIVSVVLPPVAGISVIAVVVCLAYAAIAGGTAWLMANGWLVAGGFGLFCVVWLVSALPRPEFESEEKEKETPVQNQTIINIYSATGGDVTVNKE